MMRGNLPPQAYTREVVANAYNWLQAQPENIRRMAQNTDSLVALYLRFKRNGENPQAPAQPAETEPSPGVESFRSQLKNLASEIQQFVPEQEKFVAAVAPPTFDQTMYTQPTAPAPRVSYNFQTSAPVDLSFLDPQSLEILKKVRQHLNLGSEVEAMRMLLVLGFEKVQILLR
jgi:hypothetical protein